MITVNIRPSVKDLVANVRLGIPNEVLLDQLEHVTTGDWANVGKRVLDNLNPSPEELYEHGASTEEDFLVGVSGDQIVSIYSIRGWRRTDGDRVVFNVEPASAKMAAAIGQPSPGGPWKRGEARPIRYFDTQAFVRGLEDLDPAIHSYQDGDVERRMVEVIRAIAYPAPSATSVEGVEVENDPRGGVRVIVPMGTKVTIVQRNE